jgi:hypothetical protein
VNRSTAVQSSRQLHSVRADQPAFPGT